MHFLLVEDEEIAERAMCRLVAPYGELRLARTVREAEQLLSTRDDWGAFFIDLGLPDGSGLDVLAQARQDHPTTPAMVLTGSLEPESINTAFDLGAAYVIKPVQKARVKRFLLEHGSFALRLEHTMTAWRQRYALSEAEADVLRRACAGETREGIAQGRGSAERTIKAHVNNLLRKTGDDSLLGAVGRVLRMVAGGGGGEARGD